MNENVNAIESALETGTVIRWGKNERPVSAAARWAGI